VDDFLHQGEGAARQPRFGALTKREREILKFNLMRKLNIHNKAQLVQYAIPKKDHPAAEADSGRSTYGAAACKAARK
jgi:hypothetical protein